MPKTKLQNIIFTLIMAFVMVYAMVCYNIAIEKGGMSNQVFRLALFEMPIEWPIACILEYFVVEKLAKKLAFRFVDFTMKPIFITISISAMIVCLMCHTMSFIATCLFSHPGKELIAVWLQKLVLNFPMAMCWQIFFAGPLVRNVFNFCVKKIESRKVTKKVSSLNLEAEAE
ncbi:MAG: DUF2798 domain-containing protein [Ruminococcus callidus]|nr:DUF2798 domain-containing protein [Ruminococcus callidus]